MQYNARYNKRYGMGNEIIWVMRKKSVRVRVCLGNNKHISGST